MSSEPSGQSASRSENVTRAAVQNRGEIEPAAGDDLQIPELPPPQRVERRRGLTEALGALDQDERGARNQCPGLEKPVDRRFRDEAPVLIRKRPPDTRRANTTVETARDNEEVFVMRSSDGRCGEILLMWCNDIVLRRQPRRGSLGRLRVQPPRRLHPEKKPLRRAAPQSMSYGAVTIRGGRDTSRSAGRHRGSSRYARRRTHRSCTGAGCRRPSRAVAGIRRATRRAPSTISGPASDGAWRHPPA